MMIRKLTLLAAVPLLLAFSAPPLRAQQQPSVEELTKKVEALTKSVQAMQKDLQEIKAMLQGRRAPVQPPPNVVLDLAGRPSQGESTAPLTLVEFSDYQ